MKGFEVRINGRKRHFLAADAHVTANFGIQWIATDSGVDILFATGLRVRLDGKTKNPVVWQTRNLKPGDEITVRLATARPRVTRPRRSAQRTRPR